MPVISIRLPEDLLHDIDANSKNLHTSRTNYIKEALIHMNQETVKKIKDQRLKNASRKVRQESLRVNQEFDEIEHDPEN